MSFAFGDADGRTVRRKQVRHRLTFSFRLFGYIQARRARRVRGVDGTREPYVVVSPLSSRRQSIFTRSGLRAYLGEANILCDSKHNANSPSHKHAIEILNSLCYSLCFCTQRRDECCRTGAGAESCARREWMSEGKGVEVGRAEEGEDTKIREYRRKGEREGSVWERGIIEPLTTLLLSWRRQEPSSRVPDTTYISHTEPFQG
ncbi:hypothetical protein R3P38DRAFT_721709 [Favolaschia claudopus]|uniref:Uncharacterized protein n=1 Tax=Favolaschia claudopus TaxID=2862362 RepID=A0AAV9Z5B4_9AGAR